MDESTTPERETWSSKMDFLLSCVGFCVGMGNVWRFPYLCYKNGGGAFLIPYVICLVFAVFPMMFLEISIGQFMSRGGHYTWQICPLLQGLGWTTTIMIFLVCVYYNVILTWALYYFFSSLTKNLPWETCNNDWNTPQCTTNYTQSYHDNLTEQAGESANSSWKMHNFPVTEFWERKVLSISDGIDSPGTIKWDLCLYLLLAWVLVYVCVCKGIKTSGKVVYFTALAPYLFMAILLIRGCTLPGAAQGILYYLLPNFNSLKHVQVWVDAGTQVFYSNVIGIGCLTTLGSYNKRDNNCLRDSIVIVGVNSATSIFAGFVVFSVLGYMAHEMGTTVDQVAESGPGLAFITYPTALAQMPLAPLWSALFFFMLVLVGLDSQFVQVEGVITPILDTFPSLRRRWYRELFIAGLCSVMFLCGLTMVTNGGMYVLQLFDYYPACRMLPVIALLELIAVAGIYGVNRYYEDLHNMFGFNQNLFIKVCWTVLAPFFCVALFLMTVINYSGLTYERPFGTYVYPTWSVVLGWTLAVIPLVPIPMFAIYNIILLRKDSKPIRDIFKPKDVGIKALHQYTADNCKMESLTLPT